MDSLNADLKPLKRELEELNERGVLGKLRAIPRARAISSQMAAIERAIAVNTLKLRGVGVARRQVLGKIKQFPGDPI